VCFIAGAALGGQNIPKLRIGRSPWVRASLQPGSLQPVQHPRIEQGGVFVVGAVAELRQQL
jgi:hypothetical protein